VSLHFVSLKKELIMKKILLGTTGLVAVALLATAASAETPKVTLGGFSDFQAGFTNDDNDANRRSHEFRNDNEITVKVDGKTAGGLGYGAEIDLEADTTADVNGQGTNAARTFTYLEGSWGRVEMGDVNSAAGNMRVDASSLAAATGGINGAWTYFVNGAVDAQGYITTSKLVVEHGNTAALGDETFYNNTKVSYYTPKWSGFQGGISYTPAMNKGQTVDRVDNTAGDFDNIWDLAVGYEGTFSNVKLAAAATYEMADIEAGATEDVSAWNLGALLGYQGWSFAASYGDWDDSNLANGLDSNDYWTLGLGYTTGPIGLSATYLDSQRSNSATTENEFSNIVLGAEYKLAAGLTPYAEVSFYDFDDADGVGSNSGTTVILGTQVAF
jgi:predicted porin